MSLRPYMDHHVPQAITAGLRRRGIDCLTALDDASHRLPDDELLRHARTIGRVLFTMDDDLLVIAAHWLAAHREFSGVIYAHPLRITIGQAVLDLELMANLLEPAEMLNRIEHLPL